MGCEDWVGSPLGVGGAVETWRTRQGIEVPSAAMQVAASWEERGWPGPVPGNRILGVRAESSTVGLLRPLKRLLRRCWGVDSVHR